MQGAFMILFLDIIERKMLDCICRSTKIYVERKPVLLADAFDTLNSG